MARRSSKKAKEQENSMPESQMPVGRRSRPAGESAGDMPGPAMSPEPVEPIEMPSGKMEGAAPGRDMPTFMKSEEMEDEGRLFAQRFPPRDVSPGAAPPAAYEPGLVEVEFREGLRPRISRPSASAPPSIESRAEQNLGDLNQILQEYHLQRAEPSIQTTEREALRAQEAAQAVDPSIPNLANFVTLHFPPEADTRQIAEELSRLPEVERAVPIPRAIPPQSPLDEPLLGTTDQVVLDNATGLENQWYIFRCRADRAWSMASGVGVVIADIDWGYNINHQDLAPHLDLNRAYNAFDGGSNVSTGASVSHGTGVMGIAGASDNNLGMSGFAYEATLWPVQADSGPGTPLGGNAWARAIDWVRTADSGGRRKIINLEVQTSSFGNYEMVPSVNAAIRTAIAHGVVVCVAAGNGDRDAGVDDAGNPIPETGSILVGATEYHPTDNCRAWFSNFAPRVTVSAPGDSAHDLTCSHSANSAYRNGFGGTSGATPKVAGTVALMLQLNPSLTHEEIRAILRDTGAPVVTDPAKPVGTFLNAEAAVQAAARPRPSGPVVAWGPNRLDAFVIGTNSGLFHKWWDGAAWGPSVTGYEFQGGTVTSDPEVVAWGPNRLDVFVLGTDAALYHKWWNGAAWGPSLTGFEFMGGTVIAEPKVVAWGPNRLDVFVIGTDSALYHKWWNGAAWGPSVTGYEFMGGTILGDPEAVAWGPNRLDVFVLGSNSALYHKWWNGSAWGPSVTGYEFMGGTVIAQPKVVSWGPNRLDVFVIGTDSALYHKWWNGSAWGPSVTGYEFMGGTILGAPEVVSWGPNRLDVFVVGTNARLYHKWWDGSAWGPSLTGYEDLGGTILGQPKAVAWGPNRLDIFVTGTDSALYHKWWDGAAWGPSITGYEPMGGTIIKF